jgi:hypothetical protein
VSSGLIQLYALLGGSVQLMIVLSPIVKGAEELVDEFTRGDSDGFMSCVIAILYFGSIYALEKLGNGIMWTPTVRGLLADYAYPVCWKSPASICVGSLTVTYRSVRYSGSALPIFRGC